MAARRFSIVIKRPIEAVYDFMDDVSREPAWQSSIRSARVEPPGPTTVGSRKIYESEFMGRTVSNTYVAKVVEANERVVYETTPQSTVQATASFSWKPVEGGTKVTMSIEGRPSGVLRLIPEPILNKVYESEIIATLKRLRKILEEHPK